jgi:WD40 repeat protein
LIGFHFLENKIITWDETIDVWEPQTGVKILTLSGHAKKMNCTATQKNFIVSGSSDKQVKRWDLQAGVCVQTFVGHTAAIQAVCYNLDEIEEKIASGTKDLIKLWDARVAESVLTFKGSGSVRCIQMDKYKVRVKFRRCVLKFEDGKRIR